MWDLGSIARIAAKVYETPSSLERDLRASIEVNALAWAICQSERALNGRPVPAKFTDLHHRERQDLMDRALETLMGLNREAHLYALLQADIAALELFEQFCKDHDLDWLDGEHPINENDQLEVLFVQISNAAVKRYRHTLSGIFPGLSKHLARQERLRTTDTDPDLPESA